MPSVSRRGGAVRRLATPLAVVVAIAVMAPASHGQMVPAGFSASVRVDSAYYRGETLYVVHTASNSAASPGPLWGFVLEARTPSLMQNRPSTGRWLMNVGEFGGRQSAEWLGLGAAKVRPGGHTPPLTVAAVGVPDVVSYWVIAYAPPKQVEDPDAELAVNPMLQRSVRGVTVGIVPPPAGATAQALATRLHDLLRRSCGDLAWISQRGVCQSLDVKMTHAEGALAAGEPELAQNDLRAFIQELDAQHGDELGKHVSDRAYALLRANAMYLLARR
jgi:hypothetical protein